MSCPAQFWLSPSLGTKLADSFAIACRWKTVVFVFLYYLPFIPRTRLKRLERPSSRISINLGDQVTQGRPPRPGAPGPPSLSGLLNEHSLERKLHRVLSGVISSQAIWGHHKRTNHPLRLSLDRLGFTVESRSTGYQPKTAFCRFGCGQRLASPLTQREDPPTTNSNDYVVAQLLGATAREFKRRWNLGG